MFCQKCGTQNEDVAKFCANCGEALEPVAEQAQPQPQAQEGAAFAGAANPVDAGFYPEAEAPQNDNTKKIIKIAVAAVAAIIIVVLGYNIISGLFGPDKIDYEKHPVVYNKDGEIMIQLAGKAKADKAVKLGEEDDIADVYVTRDGKYLFYGDDKELASNEFDLCYRKANDAKGKSIKEIEKGVSNFDVTPDGKMVAFIKGEKLYISNLKKAEVVDKDVNNYSIIGDGKYLIYTVAEKKEESSEEDEYSFEDYSSITYELYICKMKVGAEATKIADGISGWPTIPTDTETGREAYKGLLYYSKDGDLYYAKDGKKTEKLLADVDNTGYVGKTFFAVTKSEKTIDEKDAVKEVEDESGYTYNELRPGVITDYDVENGETIYKKVSYKIHKVDGTKVKKLDGEFTSVALYNNVAYKNEECFVITEGAKLISIGKIAEDASFECVSEDGKYVFLIENIAEDGEDAGLGKLNRYPLSSKGLGKKKEIAADVSGVVGGFNDAIFVETRDDSDSILNVYYKNKYYAEIGENAEIVDDSYFACDNSFYFLDDLDGGADEGTLMRYTLGKKEAVKIDDDVTEISARSDKMLYYIADWDDDDDFGTLFLAKGNGEPKVVDEEVKSIKN